MTGFRDFRKAGHWPTLLSAFLYFDVSFMVWMLIGVLGVHIAGDFGLTAGQKGLLVAIPILGGALVRIPLGLLVDKYGPKKAGLIAQTMVILPLVWGWLGAKDMSELHALGLLLGIAGGSFAVALPLAGRWYPAKHQGLAMGIAGAGNSGTVLAALIAPRLAESYGWHGVFGLALIPILTVFALFALIAKEPPKPAGAKNAPAHHRQPLLEFIAQPDMLRFCFLYAFTFGGFVGMASFLVIFFHDQYGLTKIQAGNFAALCVFSGSFLRPVGGWLADRFGGLRMLQMLVVGAALMLLGLATLPALPMATLLLFLLMAQLGMGNGSVFQLVPHRFAKDLGLATGVIGAAGGIGGFALPFILGRLKDATGSYSAGLIAFAAIGLGCLLILKAVAPKWHGSWLVMHAPKPIPEPASVQAR